MKTTKTKLRKQWAVNSTRRYQRNKEAGLRPLQVTLSNADHKLVARLSKGTTRRQWLHELIRMEAAKAGLK